MVSKRVLCLYVPRFRVVVERERRPELASGPLIVYRPGGRPVVAEACAEAAADGVVAGMLLSRALSYCPQAVTVPAEESYYAAANAELLRPLLALTPEVELGDLGLAFMSLAGLERLVGDEAAVAAYLTPQPPPLKGEGEPEGLGSPRIGIAGGRFAAEMAARYGGAAATLLAPGEERPFIAALPLEVLPAPDPEWREMHRRLRLLGLRRLGEVAALGQVAMQAQFGAAGLRAWRLAAAQPEALRPLPIPRQLVVKRQFGVSQVADDDAPGSREAAPALGPLLTLAEMEAALAEMVADLARLLRWEGWACVALRVAWQAEGEREQEREAPLKEPSAAPAALLAALRRCLGEAVQVAAVAVTGPVVELRLSAEALAPQVGKQMTLFEGRKQAARVERVARELQQRLGWAAICKVERLGPSHLEERTYAFRPVG